MSESGIRLFSIPNGDIQSKKIKTAPQSLMPSLLLVFIYLYFFLIIGYADSKGLAR